MTSFQLIATTCRAMLNTRIHRPLLSYQDISLLPMVTILLPPFLLHLLGRATQRPPVLPGTTPSHLIRGRPPLLHQEQTPRRRRLPTKPTIRPLQVCLLTRSTRLNASSSPRTRTRTSTHRFSGRTGVGRPSANRPRPTMNSPKIC